MQHTGNEKAHAQSIAEWYHCIYQKTLAIEQCLVLRSTSVRSGSLGTGIQKHRLAALPKQRNCVQGAAWAPAGLPLRTSPGTACSHSCLPAPPDYPTGHQVAQQAQPLLSSLGSAVSGSSRQDDQAPGAPASSTETEQMTLCAPGAAHFQPLSQGKRTLFPRITVPIRHLSKLEAKPRPMMTDILSSKRICE